MLLPAGRWAIRWALRQHRRTWQHDPYQGLKRPSAEIFVDPCGAVLISYCDLLAIS